LNVFLLAYNQTKLLSWLFARNQLASEGLRAVSFASAVAEKPQEKQQMEKRKLLRPGLPSSFWPPRHIFQLLFGWMLLASTLISVFGDLTSVNSLAASPLTKLLSLDKSTQGPFETHELLGRKLVTFLV